MSLFKRKQISLRLWWATAIHQCQGMTVGEGEVDRHIVIHPRTTAFEFRNVGALFVAISRAKSAGKIILIPTLHGIPPSWQMHTVYSTKLKHQQQLLERMKFKESRQKLAGLTTFANI